MTTEKRTGRKYTEEFKRDAVALVTEQSYKKSRKRGAEPEYRKHLTTTAFVSVGLPPHLMQHGLLKEEGFVIHNKRIYDNPLFPGHKIKPRS